MSTRVRVGTVAVIWATVGVLALGTSTAAPSVPRISTLASWQMNEGSGAHTMVDSSGHGINGSIGSAVKTGVHVAGATAYRWTFTSPTNPPPKPQRLIQVKDSRLNPGSGDFAITMRFRTTKTFGNIIQKGQAGSSGGYFKMQIPNGVLSCMFKGKVGTSLQGKTIKSSGKLNDGSWHVLRCARTRASLSLTVDGSTKSVSGQTGSISNPNPLTIGGKLNCDQLETTCDYFTGDIDYVKIES